VFFKRTLDPVHVIAVSVWHRGNDLVIAGSRVAKKNAGHHFTNVELVHRPLPNLLHHSCLLLPKRQATLRQKEGKRQINSWRAVIFSVESLRAYERQDGAGNEARSICNLLR
jgi:hypothetical protein